MSEFTVDTRFLNSRKEHKLFVSLPHRFGEDSVAIDACLEKLGIKEINDDNFEQVYQQVREQMQKDYPYEC